MGYQNKKPFLSEGIIMPHMYWKGIDIAGDIKKGTVFAHTVSHLQDYLFKRGIALLGSRKAIVLRQRKISSAVQAHIFRQLATLLESGVLLAPALMLCADQAVHVRAQELLYEMEQHVRNGGSFSSAVKQMSAYFNPLIRALLCAGDESGMVARACIVAADFFRMKEKFASQVRSALIMPLVSAVFVCLVIVAVGGFVIPRSVSLYASLGKPIPALTSALLVVGNGISSWQALLFVVIVALCCVLLYRLRTVQPYSYYCDLMLLKIPYFGALYQSYLIVQWLQGLALLSVAGIPLPDALRLLDQHVSNQIFRMKVHRITLDVARGESFTRALEQQDLFSPMIISCIATGEEAGKLPVMVQKAADYQMEWVHNRLRSITIWIQPVLLLLLGLLVAGLIFALYIPILSLTDLM